jgi:sugar/nucleoside kinase (ribokinase family)
MRKLCVVGNAAIETKLFVESFPPEESEVEIKRSRVSTGGSGACVSAILERLGFDVDFVTQIGDGIDGERILGNLQRAKVGIRHVVRGGESTLFYSIFDTRFRRRMLIRSTSWDEDMVVSNIEKSIEESDALVLCPSTESIFVRAMEIAKEHAKTLIVSPQTAFVDHINIVQDAFRCADVACLNERELRMYTATESWVEGIGKLKAKEGQIFIVTRGVEGCVVVTHDEVVHQNALGSEVADPSGAGDSLLAAFLWSYCRDHDIHKAALAGCAAGFLACNTPDLVAEGFLPDDIEEVIRKYGRSEIHG